MTVEDTDVADVTADAPEVESNGQGPSADFISSLAERVQHRRAELEANPTVILEVIGYEDFLAVEYNALSWPQTQKIQSHHARQRDDGVRGLYIAADTLIAACVQTYGVTETGQRIALNQQWGAKIAQMLGWTDVNIDATPRQAILSYIFRGRDTWLMAHYGDYSMWLQGQRNDDDEVVREDFERTQ